MRRRSSRPDNADGPPGLKMLRQSAPGHVAAEGPELALRLRSEYIKLHGLVSLRGAGDNAPPREPPPFAGASRFFGAAINPSRIASLRASLRARRIASALCRVALSDG